MSKFSSRFSTPKERQAQGTFDTAKRQRRKRMRLREIRRANLGVAHVMKS